MNRFFIAIAMAALLMQAAIAQDVAEPSESSVLDAARSKYWSDEPQSEERDDEAAPDESHDADGVDEGHFTPFLISFVPGISTPLGYFDAAFSAGIVGVATRDISGFQGAGVFGLARRVEGVQGAGVFSIAEGDVDGFQCAGVFAIAGGNIEGTQCSGVFNIAGKRVDGFQIAGVFNQATRVDGGQIASLVNIADEVDGVQIGLVNIANKVDGLQIGLVNIAHKSGVNSTGAFYEPETDYVYAVLQSGSRSFYSVLAAGFPRDDWGRSGDGLVLGYGFGSRIGLGESYLDYDISAESHIGPEIPAIGEAIETGHRVVDMSSLVPYPSFRACLGVPLLGKLHLVGGIKVDFDLDDAPRVPEALKQGRPWSSELFGAGFKAWTKWYLGIKI